MKAVSVLPKAPVNVLIIFLGLIIAMLNDRNAYALSAEQYCERPNFKLWKVHQAERLWTPSANTLSAERSGKVFTYNCFTMEEIDKFFSLHEDRIENANFRLILLPGLENGDDDEEACD